MPALAAIRYDGRFKVIIYQVSIQAWNKDESSCSSSKKITGNDLYYVQNQYSF